MNRKQRRATAKVGQTSSYPGATAATAATLGAAELLRAGLEHHQAGRLAEAETYYRRVLAADPRHADALYLLGVVAQQVGRADLAVDLIGQAIKRNKQNPLYHLTRATALEDLQQLDQALACYDKALALKPDYAEAFYSLGIALKKIGSARGGAGELRPGAGAQAGFCGGLQQPRRRAAGAAALRRGGNELR